MEFGIKLRKLREDLRISIFLYIIAKYCKNNGGFMLEYDSNDIDFWRTFGFLTPLKSANLLEMSNTNDDVVVIIVFG
jgi:hypothetical protein